VPALINSGIPCDKFVFEGFLPIKKGRKTRLEKLSYEDRTMVFYESPHKILRTLKDFKTVFGNERKISISRELTKIFEENIRGSILEVLRLISEKPPKGELVIIVEGYKKSK
jgi:16S rRNA (cytidine1402-2'-O)-methyltransferase